MRALVSIACTELVSIECQEKKRIFFRGVEGLYEGGQQWLKQAVRVCEIIAWQEYCWFSDFSYVEHRVDDDDAKREYEQKGS
jgi:hypothetical protein